MNFNPQTVFRKQPMVYIAIALTSGDVIRIDDQSYIRFLLPINKNLLENTQLAMKIVNGSNSILFIDKLTYANFEI